jgi:fibrillarin-like pre-rRNA processing protein
MTNVEPHERFPGIYWITLEDGTRRLATINLSPGIRVYGEIIVNIGGNEYRILKGINLMPIKPGSKVLYLGASTGTTVSHVSDIVGDQGIIYAVEFAPRVAREFIEKVVKYRSNIIPIYNDATQPHNYSALLDEVDVIYCDIAQPQQAKPLADNADLYLTNGGSIMLAIKAMSIDVTKEPSETYKREIKVLTQRGFNIIDMIHLEPYDKDHAMITATYTIS